MTETTDYFNKVIGLIEDVVISDDFQVIFSCIFNLIVSQ